jgi:hypothetical protein
MKIEVILQGIVPDKMAKQQMLVLKAKENDDGKYLPIWIGNLEAASIKQALQENPPPSRPITHELLKGILDSFKVTLQKVVIYKLVQGTFFAHLYLDKNGTEFAVDARPSDAISVALRMNAPVYIEEEVFEKQRIGTVPESPESV